MTEHCTITLHQHRVGVQPRHRSAACSSPHHSPPELCCSVQPLLGCPPAVFWSQCLLGLAVISCHHVVISPNSLYSHRGCGQPALSCSWPRSLLVQSCLSHHPNHPVKKGWRSLHVALCNLAASWRFSSFSYHLSQIPSFSDPFISSCSVFKPSLMWLIVYNSFPLCFSPLSNPSLNHSRFSKSSFSEAVIPIYAVAHKHYLVSCQACAQPLR